MRRQHLRYQPLPVASNRETETELAPPADATTPQYHNLVEIVQQLQREIPELDLTKLGRLGNFQALPMRDFTPQAAAQLLADNLPSSTPHFTSRRMVMLSNLFKLTQFDQIKEQADLHAKITVLNECLMKDYVLSKPKYHNLQQTIAALTKKHHISFTDKLLRWGIAFNAGLGAGNVVYGVATNILLNLPVVIISGGSLLALWILISNHFWNTFQQEDAKYSNRLKYLTDSLNHIADDEAKLRLKCYHFIIQKIALASACHKMGVHPIPDWPELTAIIQAGHNTNFIRLLDDFISKKTVGYQQEISSTAKLKQVPEDEYNSIYTEIFNSKYWGPVLSFFGATGTLFGLTKNILDLVGITTLWGATAPLLLLVAGAAVVISGLLALKHWHFNIKAEHKKAALKTFEEEKFDQLIIAYDKLKKIKTELKKTNHELELALTGAAFKKADTVYASAIEKTVNAAYGASCGLFAQSPEGFFKRQNQQQPTAVVQPAASGHALALR